jgi:hypothetical protein
LKNQLKPPKVDLELKTDKKSTSSEEKKKQNDKILFKIDGNLEIKKSSVDKRKLFCDLNISL